MKTLNDMLGDGHGLLVRSEMVHSTQSYTVTSDGWAVLTGMGGGAGGVVSFAPGNSAPWGVKAVGVRAGDVITFQIGAGGIAAPSGQPARAGSSTIISINGAAVLTCQGGDGGTSSVSALSPLNAQVLGADAWAKGAQPKDPYFLCGAAVDAGWGTYSLTPNAGDYCVDISGIRGAPRGYYFWPFEITFQSNQQGDVGAGSSNGVAAGMFGGGVGFSGALNLVGAGRGGSSGRGSYGYPADGGAGLGYLRLYKRIGG